MRNRCRLTSHRHAAHHVDLKPQSASKKAFKKIKGSIISGCNKVEARIRGFEVRKHSPNYGALDKLFKKAVSVSVHDDGELLIINIPQY